MRNLRRRTRLLLWLILVVVVVLLVVQICEISYYDIAKLSYEKAHIDQSAVERVRVSDVLAVREFIAAIPATQRGQKLYNYNHAHSDRIGAFRALPDTRDVSCSGRNYYIPSQSSKVSVIIVYHNEARATLLRTLMSVYRRSPSKYLHELILIDDFSEDALLLPALQALNFPPFTDDASTTPASPRRSGIIKMQRNSRRLGVIASRNRGAQLATGDFLLFLDSHCEVNVGWLEPLLERVAAGARRHGASATAVSPVLDSIDAESLEYRPSARNLMGGIDWNLHFHWIRRSDEVAGRRSGAPEDAVSAYRSPIFAGGVFMISRNWFFKLNAFNTLLQIWGGESIEFSIKLWLCGGQIEIVPCSRVGHIFRNEHAFDFPHGDSGQATYLRNSKIIAESWLDAYKYIFYASKPTAKNVSVNISHAALNKLKKDLRCRPFAWYLQNVFTELKLPNEDFIAFGTLSSAERCLQSSLEHAATAAAAPNATGLLLASCYQSDVTHWYLHRHSLQLFASTGGCLAVGMGFMAVLQPCLDLDEVGALGQRWLRLGAQLVHEQTHLCLENTLRDFVTASQCRREAPSQLFRFEREVQQL